MPYRRLRTRRRTGLSTSRMVGLQPAVAAQMPRLDAALLGEFEGVRQQVFQHLLQALGVGDNAAVQMVVELDIE